MDEELTGAQDCPTFVAPATQAAWSAADPTQPVRTYRGHVRRRWAVLGVLGALGLGAGAVWVAQSTARDNTDEHNTWITPGVSTPAAMPTDTALPDAPFVTPTQTAEHLAAPAPPPPPGGSIGSGGDETRFLQLLMGEGYRIDDPSTAVRTGYLACQNLALTHNLYTTHMYVHNVLGVMDPNADDITIAASIALCPGTPF